MIRNTILLRLVLLHLVISLNLVLSAANAKLSSTKPSLIIINADMITMSKTMDNQKPTALAIANGLIVHIGSNRSIKAVAEHDTPILDLNGKTLMPGFIDAHGHFPASGLIDEFMLNLNSPPIGKINSIADIVSLIRTKAKNLPPGEWIRGFGYDDTLLQDMRHPDRHDLDQASMAHPIYLTHISGHIASVNTLALNLAGVSATTKQLPGSRILRESRTGHPTGILEEPPAFTMVSKLIPQFSQTQLLEGIAAASKQYASVGVTMAQQGAATHISESELFIKAEELGLLQIRVQIWPTAKQVIELIESGRKLNELTTSKKVKYGAIKGFADGSIQGYTAYLSKPYFRHDDKNPNFRGYPRHNKAFLQEQIVTLHKEGYQIAVHGNGDAAIDDIIDSFEEAQKHYPRDNTRHIIIHAQMVREDQLNRIAKLGVIPSFFNLHTYYWGDRHQNIFLGPKRAARISPARSALEKNIVFTFHTDTPVVPMEPMRIIWAAVNRMSSSGNLIGKDQRISVQEALKASTVNAAYQGFNEQYMGQIGVGKYADLIVLDKNPLNGDPRKIDEINVLRTIVSGKTVYERK